MEIVGRYVTDRLTTSEIVELSNYIRKPKFVLNELREIQLILNDEKHPNKIMLLNQFRNLLDLYSYLKST